MVNRKVEVELESINLNKSHQVAVDMFPFR